MDSEVGKGTQVLGYVYTVKQLPTDGGRWHGSCPTLGATWLINTEKHGHELAESQIALKLRQMREADQPVPPPDAELAASH